jgi:hypothetical protein
MRGKIVYHKLHEVKKNYNVSTYIQLFFYNSRPSSIAGRLHVKLLVLLTLLVGLFI